MVLERLSAARLLIDVGFPVEIDMPQDTGTASIGLDTRVACELTDEPRVTLCRLDP